MSSITTAKISDSKEALEAEVHDNAAGRRTGRTDPAARRDYKTKLAQAGSKPNTAPTSSTKIITDNVYHDARISGSDLILENFNEIDYHSPGIVQLTTTAFKGAIITGGRISSGARAAPRNLV